MSFVSWRSVQVTHTPIQSSPPPGSFLSEISVPLPAGFLFRSIRADGLGGLEAWPVSVVTHPNMWRRKGLKLLGGGGGLTHTHKKKLGLTSLKAFAQTKRKGEPTVNNQSSVPRWLSRFFFCVKLRGRYEQ